MNKLFVYGLMVFGIYYMLKGSFGIVDDIQGGKLALLMSGITESELHEKIISHYKATVLDGVTELYANAIETTVTDLNEDGKKDVIAIVESGATCGSGGCIASIFIENDLGELTAIPFAYAVKSIQVLDTMTLGMHDIRINDDEASKMIWDGTTYVLEQI
jgi:hypothetical protein